MHWLEPGVPATVVNVLEILYFIPIILPCNELHLANVQCDGNNVRRERVFDGFSAQVRVLHKPMEHA